MVAITHPELPRDETRERRLRCFLKIYSALTLLVPLCICSMCPWILLPAAVLILPEVLWLALLVQQGRDTTTTCRWLGWFIVARVIVVGTATVAVLAIP